MTERVRVTADELVVYADQHSILCVSGAARLLAVAHGGVHILSDGKLTVAGVIRRGLMIELGGACWPLPPSHM